MARYVEKEKKINKIEKRDNSSLENHQNNAKKARNIKKIRLISIIISFIVVIAFGVLSWFLFFNDGSISGRDFADRYYISSNRLTNIQNGEAQFIENTVYIIVYSSDDYDNSLKQDKVKLYEAITNLYKACANSAEYDCYVIDISEDSLTKEEFVTVSGKEYDGKTPTLFTYEDNLLETIKDATTSRINDLANRLK